jgi:hypothetical protein
VRDEPIQARIIETAGDRRGKYGTEPDLQQEGAARSQPGDSSSPGRKIHVPITRGVSAFGDTLPK